ncbi:dihydrolipoamide acetyltransferase family protein [Nocardioides mesophilus]|uniref:Dihydrolipoamide acetyltransferase component of pyruvate dehydrogenase complex n=1 Tax=Nocardioides mesophilus TaxID=433659 RepID=A0A7G9RE39_9ACTN|nr:dihydrolipoamide acetyltransferase family protein [Nocardioides mesophilus]QNN53864.1 2-oxo acid dehydrogenase subunit E2 [Nocardioides mesophilus]
MPRIPIRMPKMSMTMTEGEVASWLAKVGDEIAAGDVVCEVMTDKVDMEVESTSAGTLVEIVVEQGMVPVGEPIAWLEGDVDLGLGDLLGEEPEPDAVVPDDAVAAPVLDVPATAPAPAAPAPADERPPAAIPRARALARQHGLDLASISGSGSAGLITMADVEARLAAPAGSAGAAATPNGDRPAAAAAVAAPAAPVKASGAKADRSAMIRAAVARKMTESAVVPQFTVWRDVVLDTADRQRDGVSWTTVLLQSYAAALRQVPELLCRWDAEGGAVPSGPPAVALAVATAGGLLVPVFTEPDTRDPHDLDREVKAVVSAAHTGRLDPSYLTLANGSLSNLGGMGVDRFQALVTPPQASVLALGSIKPRPVAVPGGLGVALSLTAGLTVDHRVGDGAHGARLLEEFAARLSG